MATRRSKWSAIPTASRIIENEDSLRICARLRPADPASGRRPSKWSAARRLLSEQPVQPLAVVRRQGAAPTLQAKGLEFSVDHVFDADQGQAECYEQGVRERVAWALKGHNVTVLAYGQTGSGKTHTMFGAEEALADLCGSDPQLHGIVPRACRQLFEGAAAAARPRLRVRISFLEIHLDRLRDLLAPAGHDAPALSLRETPSQGLVVEGLWHEVASSAKEAVRHVQRGSAARAVGRMQMNERSSRGHGILAISLHDLAGDLAGGGGDDAFCRSTRRGRLVLVDLAGMESSKKSGAAEKRGAASLSPSDEPLRREEARHINQSLCALGTVIERLHDRVGSHVPYRDSKLTRLLQETLGGGGSRSVLVATLRTEEESLDESLGTLRFALRAKAVRVLPRQEISGPSFLEIEELQQANEQLVYSKEQLQASVEAQRSLVRRLGEVELLQGGEAARRAAAEEVAGAEAQRRAEAEAEAAALHARLDAQQAQAEAAQRETHAAVEAAVAAAQAEGAAEVEAVARGAAAREAALEAALADRGASVTAMEAAMAAAVAAAQAEGAAVTAEAATAVEEMAAAVAQAQAEGAAVAQQRGAAVAVLEAAVVDQRQEAARDAARAAAARAQATAEGLVAGQRSAAVAAIEETAAAMETALRAREAEAEAKAARVERMARAAAEAGAAVAVTARPSEKPCPPSPRWWKRERSAAAAVEAAVEAAAAVVAACAAAAAGPAGGGSPARRLLAGHRVALQRTLAAQTGGLLEGEARSEGGPAAEAEAAAAAGAAEELGWVRRWIGSPQKQAGPSRIASPTTRQPKGAKQRKVVKISEGAELVSPLSLLSPPAPAAKERQSSPDVILDRLDIEPHAPPAAAAAVRPPPPSRAAEAAGWVTAASLLLLGLLLLLRHGVLPHTHGLGSTQLDPISSPISSRIFLASLGRTLRHSAGAGAGVLGAAVGVPLSSELASEVRRKAELAGEVRRRRLQVDAAAGGGGAEESPRAGRPRWRAEASSKSSKRRAWADVL